LIQDYSFTVDNYGRYKRIKYLDKRDGKQRTAKSERERKEYQNGMYGGCEGEGGECYVHMAKGMLLNE